MHSGWTRWYITDEQRAAVSMKQGDVLLKDREVFIGAQSSVLANTES